MKADWFGEMSSFRTSFNRLAKTFAMILYKTLQMIISL